MKSDHMKSLDPLGQKNVNVVKIKYDNRARSYTENITYFQNSARNIYM